MIEYRKWLVQKFGWEVFQLSTVEVEIWTLEQDICDRKEKYDVDKSNYETGRR